MYKIVAVMRSWELWGSERAKPRLMFVTRSSMLADQVHSTTSRLLEAFRLASLTDDELNLEVNSQRMPPEHLDESERRHNLPRTWSALEDKHFPLFVTIDEACTLSPPVSPL